MSIARPYQAHLAPELAAAGFPEPIISAANTADGRWWARTSVADRVEVEIDEENGDSIVFFLSKDDATDDTGVRLYDWKASFNADVPPALVTAFALLARHYTPGIPAEEFLTTLTATLAPADAEIVTPVTLTEEANALLARVPDALTDAEGAWDGDYATLLDNLGDTTRHLRGAADKVADHTRDMDGPAWEGACEATDRAAHYLSDLVENFEQARDCARKGQQDSAENNRPSASILPALLADTRPATGVFAALASLPGTAITTHL